MIPSAPPNTADATDFSPLWRGAQTIAVVGLSPKTDRPSNRVARYLLDQGFTVIPVNPGHAEILGQKCYDSLTAIGYQVDIIDIFRKSEDVLPVVAEAIAIGAKAIWMQEGVVNNEAAALAKSHGLVVVMDRCLMIEHRRGQEYR
ncbi:MAG: CoA-binding protein [Desulfobulbaceae bacterium]|nr:CoA-binding protein [Desulfobulbaceae bacterium]